MPSIKFRISATESVADGLHKIDKEKGIIPNVKILGKMSKNGREYTDPALRQAAALYEGCRVNIDHPTKEKIKSPRGTLEQWGWLESVEVRGDGVYGNLHYLKTHPHTESLLELAERRPDKCGLSHNADCAGYWKGDVQVIEAVDCVRSVDLVQKPATTFGLYESEDEMPGKKTTIKSIMESYAEGSKQRKRLKSILEMDGMADMGITPDMAVETGVPEEEGSATDPMADAIETMVVAILRQDIPNDEKILQITHILQGPTAAGGEGGAAPATEGVDESKTTLQRMKWLENSMKARDILDEADIKATPPRIKSVIAVMESEDELEALIADLPKRTASNQFQPPTPAPSKRPARSEPLMEGQNEPTPKSALPFTDGKTFAAMVR